MSTWQLRSDRPLPAQARGVSRHGETSYLGWTGCAVMGVVNVTPDSFSDGGLHASTDLAVEHARRLVDEGALVIDVGGESTRPGSTGVEDHVELERILPVIEQVAADGT